ncbi:hypothetical protein PIB30_028746 [Stylosanthes scabra]|uniref:Glutaredoxin domain-containing protein n=1 Tax=Stylosanthes scabra TaxID=79078 RepID=A0ABU6WAV8_9FABA|nr:hypothetical protein [Stylosanthes scabra]
MADQDINFKIMIWESSSWRYITLRGYREEPRKSLSGKVLPHKLFIKGRYIGGVDEVIGLHESGWLGKLPEGTPIESGEGHCNGCACMRFAICSNCNGSCKVFTKNNGDNNNGELFIIRCPECNENGLVKCRICCEKFDPNKKKILL